MEWTKKKPTKKGWYWCYDSRMSRPQVEVAWVIRQRGKLKAAFGLDEDPYPLSEYTHWIGPIPEPKPPA